MGYKEFDDEVYDFIEKYIEEHKYGPTTKELYDEFACSPSTVCDAVTRLEEQHRIVCKYTELGRRSPHSMRIPKFGEYIPPKSESVKRKQSNPFLGNEEFKYIIRWLVKAYPKMQKEVRKKLKEQAQFKQQPAPEPGSKMEKIAIMKDDYLKRQQWRMNCIDEALLGVPEKYRKAVWDHSLSDMRYDACAAKHGVSERSLSRWQSKFFYDIAINLGLMDY